MQGLAINKPPTGRVYQISWSIDKAYKKKQEKISFRIQTQKLVN